MNKYQSNDAHFVNKYQSNDAHFVKKTMSGDRDTVSTGRSLRLAPRVCALVLLHTSVMGQGYGNALPARSALARKRAFLRSTRPARFASLLASRKNAFLPANDGH